MKKSSEEYISIKLFDSWKINLVFHLPFLSSLQALINILVLTKFVILLKLSTKQFNNQRTKVFQTYKSFQDNYQNSLNCEI